MSALPNKVFSSRRPAFTLLEILLVVGILVAVAAVAAPSVNQSFANQTIVKAADRVRVSMGQARVRAIRSGKIHIVGYLPNSGWLDVAALDQISAVASQASRRLREQDAGITSNYDDDLLPGRVRFAAGETVEDARAADALSNAADANQLRTILFYPDGSSQDAQVTLQNEVGQLVDVRLRGLTGTASVLRRIEGRQ